MKIVVVGYSASGKSTFSKALSAFYGIPVLHIDTIYFGPNMYIHDKQQTESQIHSFMAQPSWIIDGTYRYLATERYDLSDQMFLFDFNRFKCLMGVLKRYTKYRGNQRDTMAKGNPEKLDWGFIKWILWDGRTKASKQLFNAFQTTYQNKIVVFKNRRQVTAYLNQLKQQQ
jgi:adenylate kinase family enzyme